MGQVIDRELSKKQQLNKSQRRRAANKKKKQQKQHQKEASLPDASGTRGTEGLDQCHPVLEPEPATHSPGTAESEAARSTFSIERTLWEHEGTPRVSLLRGCIAWQHWQSKATNINSRSANVQLGIDETASQPRRHQLRRHLSGASHPVLGDTQYGKGRINR